MNAMKTCEKSMPGKRYRLRLGCEKRKNGIGHFGPDDGGQFFTPREVIRAMVHTVDPQLGQTVYDPCCGSSGMFVQSVEFIRAHAKGNGNGGKAKADISIYGQESNYTTWRLARMNLAMHPAFVNDSVYAWYCDNFLINADGQVEHLHRTPQQIVELG